ncbi:MAG: three-Cys-motif partner protein TcmP [Anaerolineae bacterium]|nr:three-Cys-motif partner protein TcmP [Anaerolineae bacterium]
MENFRVREIGPWTYEEKLAILGEYLGGEEYKGGFAYATKAARATFYIDAFAGPGKCRVRGTDNIVDGSPLIALRVKPAFTEYFFLEHDEMAIKALKQWISKEVPDMWSRVNIVPGDCNDTVEQVLTRIPEWAPCLAFLDPEGPELHWETVAKIATSRKSSRYRKIELLILFPYDMAIVRLMPRDPSKLIHATIIDRVMPDPKAWRRIYATRVSGEMDAKQVRRAIAESYRDGLLKLGYKHIPAPRLVEDLKGGPLYFLFFASDHVAGRRIIDYVFNKVRGAIVQLSFWPRRYEEEY